MSENFISKFADQTAREAYTVTATKRGHIFYQLDDGSYWRAIATGTGATVWERVTGGSKVVIAMPAEAALNGTGTTYMACPVAGKVTDIRTVLNGAVDSNGGPTLTFSINTTAITGGVVTIAASSAAGAIDSATPTAANTVAITDYIKCVAADNGQLNAVTASVFVTIEQYS